ncbi:proteasome assembly chaperone 4 isoform X2 [Manihot esculenta]|uniref:Proteasome assembly chaperone 4 n=1 Tax=Manihot esculenta TaxID=3983 RepID=A0A2C9W9E2_MANES|nr:proteasome assembly chaperone 4 isoform X2 [Manihot esculenta]OAY56212.1 hypothetical protein MANES_03G210800v8 [Manihot esculenta]
MSGINFGFDAFNGSPRNLKREDSPSSSAQQDDVAAGGLQVHCFTEIVDDTTLHFQIIRLHKQIYAWIGCNSAKFGHLYAAAPTRPSNTVSVACLLGGASDNTGSGIARRLALKTGLNIILACNIPKNAPMLEVNAEKKLVEKLTYLGYTKKKLLSS